HAGEAPEAQATPAEIEQLWRSAFEADPTLLVAFWGLRRLLVRRGAWGELGAIIERRIEALAAAEDAERARPLRADLWAERGRLSEDRLGDDGAALAAYRAAVGEDATHVGALLSLLLS